MKALVLGGLIALAPGVALAAAPADGVSAGERHAKHRGVHGKMLRRLERHLEFTELQRQNIENALLAAAPEREALRAATRANREALRALDPAAENYATELARLADERGRLESERLRLRGRLRAEIDLQLTDEQRAALESARADRPRHGRGRGHGRRRD